MYEGGGGGGGGGSLLSYENLRSKISGFLFACD